MSPSLSSLWRRLAPRSRAIPAPAPCATNEESKTKPQPQRALASEAIIISCPKLSTIPSETFSQPGRGDCSWHTLLSSPSTKSNTFTLGIGVCAPHGGHLALHRHAQAEIYYVLSGSGVVKVGGRDLSVAAEDVVFIPGDAEHGVFNDGDAELRWLYCFSADSFQDVVYRFSAEQQ